VTRVLGVDFGATYAKLVVLDVDGGQRHVVASDTVPTGARDDPEQVTARIAGLGRALLDAHGDATAVGVGLPGLFDETGGIVLFPNLPAAWVGHRIGEQLGAALGAPAHLINDARAFTLAESRMGAAAGASTVLCVTLGTGVGGGVVIDGKLRFGRLGRAGEIGHQVVEADGPPCGCGNRGCVESFATSAELCRRAGQDSPEGVFAAAASGDAQAATAVAGLVSRLAQGIGNLVTVLWPELIVVGGGVANAGEQLLGPLRAAVAAAAPLVDPASYRIVAAVLGSSAGAIGAALWAGEHTSDHVTG
jgi:glucokinase